MNIMLFVYLVVFKLIYVRKRYQLYNLISMNFLQRDIRILEN